MRKWPFTETTEEGDSLAFPYSQDLFPPRGPQMVGHSHTEARVEENRSPDICCHTILLLGVGALPTPPQFSTVQGSGEGSS